MEFKEVKIEIYIPEEYTEKLRDKLNEVNACTVGEYDYVSSATKVRGYWRPLEGANPFNGELGRVCEAEECKVELRCKREYVKDAIEAIKEVHPYEEPLINVIPVINELFE